MSSIYSVAELLVTLCQGVTDGQTDIPTMARLAQQATLTPCKYPKTPFSWAPVRRNMRNMLKSASEDGDQNSDSRLKLSYFKLCS